MHTAGCERELVIDAVEQWQGLRLSDADPGESDRDHTDVVRPVPVAADAQRAKPLIPRECRQVVPTQPQVIALAFFDNPGAGGRERIVNPGPMAALTNVASSPDAIVPSQFCTTIQ